ncbi:MAG: hypothetical protein HPM95_00760 [Alphaproteobacteria bacterium]|nr:hypothetical protein [Alphaproteobacteria bacterium]
MAERYPGFPASRGLNICSGRRRKSCRVLRVNRQGSYFALPHPSRARACFAGRWTGWPTDAR